MEKMGAISWADTVTLADAFFLPHQEMHAEWGEQKVYQPSVWLEFWTREAAGGGKGGGGWKLESKVNRRRVFSSSDTGLGDPWGHSCEPSEEGQREGQVFFHTSF